MATRMKGIFLLSLFVVMIGKNHVIGDEDTKDPVQEFKKLFHQKRIEQMAALQQILALNPDKQNKLLGQMLDQIITVLIKAKTHLDAAGFVIGQFPEDEKSRHAVALILENTCFLSDVILRFPDFFHANLKTDREKDLIYRWGLAFSVESGLSDDNTNKMLDLVSQEYGIKDKDPSFVNPYKAKKLKQKRFEDPPPKKKKEKKKMKRGPRMSTELWMLKK